MLGCSQSPRNVTTANLLKRKLVKNVVEPQKFDQELRVSYKPTRFSWWVVDVCPLDDEELSGRISCAHYDINPRTKKMALWYRMTVAAYKKLCKTRDVAENKDAHWDGIFVK